MSQESNLLLIQSQQSEPLIELNQQMNFEFDEPYEFMIDKLDSNVHSRYTRKIFDYLRKIEGNFTPLQDYMQQIQNDINERMRAILIDWLVDVHQKFRLVPETLFLTVNLIDRYLERNQITRSKLQLVGVSAMFIACKYEEIYSPELKDFVYVCDNAYSKEQILECEGHIIRSLDFDLTQTSSLRFLERYRSLSQGDERTFMLGRYLLELSLIEFKMLKYLPSLLAASGLYLACKITQKEPWNHNLKLQSLYEENSLRQCAKDLLFIFQNVNQSQLSAVTRKFSSSKFLEVSKILITI